MDNRGLTDSSKDLLACFFSECESQLRFLEQKHGYQHLSGLADFKQGRVLITPYDNQDKAGFFWAITRYEKEQHAIEIMYGDREFTIEGFVYFDGIHRLSLSEILQAAKRNEEDAQENWWLTEQNQIVKAIAGISGTIMSHKSQILGSSDKLIEKALSMRAKRMEQTIREQYKRDMQEVCKQAAKAFLEKDFKKVIELFQPYERHLSRADTKKLQLARKNLLEQTS